MKEKILWGLALSLLMTGCYEDLGNYDYHAINELEVEGIEDSYSVDVDDNFKITPTLTGTLYSDTSRFTYKWEIGSDTYETHDLNIQVNTQPGYKYSRFIVTDKETGVKTYKEFGVNVSSSTAGDLIVVLSKYQGRSELSYLRLDKPANWVVNYMKERTGYDMGSNPQQLTICYTPSARNTPFVNKNGRVMVLSDKVVHLIDKNSMTPDTVTQTLDVEAYTQVISYPKPDISGYRSEFITEGIGLWRFTTYGSQCANNIFEISNGHLFAASYLAPSVWSADYYYDIASPYTNGYLAPFGYWDDMSETPSGRLVQMGYSLGNFIVYDQNNCRFAKGSTYGSSISEIAEEDVKAFPSCNLKWGSATSRPNNTSLAVLSNGNQCCFVLLQDGTNATMGNETKTLAGEIGCGSVVSDASSFYMMNFNDYLLFSNGNALYRYNIMNISSGTAPAERDKVFSLTDFGYDSNAVITDICVSRTEKTLLVGVSRYGSDTEAQGEETKGDLLYFDLDASTATPTYNAEKSAKGISGIPIDVQIKYQTHYRNGIDRYGVLQDNI